MGKQGQGEQERDAGDGVNDQKKEYDDLFEEVRVDSAPNPTKVAGAPEHEWKEESLPSEAELKTVIAEAYDRGGEADTVILCADEACRGVLSGSVASLWCTRCGKEHKA
ncbi:hypothetical protein LCGC14_1680670 [marine sediment metagenome]|uniref:Uncharacterized protein n=1 Tax=marine sediment metagenome TaxID=412755 RepID=A0A0F9HP58_9ZZZZ